MQLDPILATEVDIGTQSVDGDIGTSSVDDHIVLVLDAIGCLDSIRRNASDSGVGEREIIAVQRVQPAIVQRRSLGAKCCPSAMSSSILTIVGDQGIEILLGCLRFQVCDQFFFLGFASGIGRLGFETPEPVHLGYMNTQAQVTHLEEELEPVCLKYARDILEGELFD